MDCKEIRELLMGYIDEELAATERAEVASHLMGCAACRKEEASFRRLSEMTESIQFVEPTEGEWRAHWEGIYNRLERGVGWILLSLGAIILLLYGAYHLLVDFMMNGAYSIILRAGVGLATAGTAVICVSVVRERLRLFRVDRYEEVEL